MNLEKHHLIGYLPPHANLFVLDLNFQLSLIRGLYIGGKKFPRGGISADVIWGGKYERPREKDGNVEKKKKGERK